MTAPPATSRITPAIHAASIRCEIERCVGDVLGCSETLDRMQCDEILLLNRGDALLIPLGEDCLRSNAVRPDSVGADLGGKVLGENYEAGLGRRIAIGDMGRGRRAAADETVMMLPVLRSFMRGKKLLIVRKVAVRLASFDARHSSSLREQAWGCNLLLSTPAAQFVTAVSIALLRPRCLRKQRFSLDSQEGSR